MSKEREGFRIGEKAMRRGRKFVSGFRYPLSPAIVYMILALVAFSFCVLFVLRFGIFGSRIDWVNQHSVFPDYFRQRFYETGDLMPDFAWNLGAGQNIYTVSYYGLFSPVILLSYLLPFVPMDIYIMVSSIVSYIAAVLLMFYWFQSHRYQISFCLAFTLLFSLSASLIYHFYNQIMFVNYMPFLCLALIGTDRFLDCGKRGFLICGTWGMILTSFYFSIGGILVLCLYALSEYLIREDSSSEQISPDKDRDEETGIHKLVHGLKKLCITGGRYVGHLILAVLLSGLLLIPTAMVIFSGERTQTESTRNALKLIAFEPLKILYYPYGVGTVMIVIVAVIGGMLCAKRWSERIMPITLFLVFAFPMVGALLNGGLYGKYKVFIPFLPILLMQCARFIQDAIRSRWLVRYALPWVITGLLLWKVWQDPSFLEYRLYALVDLLGSGVCYCLAKWKKQPALVLVFAVIYLFGYQMEFHSEANRMLSRAEYSDLHNKQVDRQVAQVLKEDSGLYRMEVFLENNENHNNINRLVNIGQNITSMYSSCYNTKYADFRKKIYHLNEPFRNNMMQSVTDNPCFLQFMGVKYWFTRSHSQNITMKKNEGAAPLWYVTNQVISESEYMKYSFPECQTVLLQRSVVPVNEMDEEHSLRTSDNTGTLPKMVQKHITIPECDTEDCSIKAGAEGSYQIQAKKDFTISVPVTGQSRNQDLLAISFDIDNKHPGRDIAIHVNQQTNKLTSINSDYANHNDTFYYMISHPANERIEITFGKGEYEIRNWKVFAGCMAALQNQTLYQQTVQTDQHGPQGDRLSGKVTCISPGYLITSIPYDDHFDVIIDGKKVRPVCVNTAFLGAKIDAGEHRIQLEYHAPGKYMGREMSVFGLILWLIIEIIGFHRRENPGVSE